MLGATVDRGVAVGVAMTAKGVCVGWGVAVGVAVTTKGVCVGWGVAVLDATLGCGVAVGVAVTDLIGVSWEVAFALRSDGRRARPGS